MPEYDYIIIGSGIAGLYTALMAQESGNVLILTKASIDDCNTKHAQGGIAAAVGKGDSPELHIEDTLAAGAGLCDPRAVRLLAREAPRRIADLIRQGVPFDTIDGEVALAREAAHSVPRVLHAGGDATGAHIETTLSRAARSSRRITILEHVLVTRLLVESGQAYGVEALDARTGSPEQFMGRAIVLATGGAGQLFRYNTNPPVATGNGVALAYQAGAEVTDVEFFQFHPTALRLPGVPPFLISEAVRGEGAILRNIHGRAFMSDYAPEKELAPRDVVSRAIVAEMQKTASDRVFLDATKLPAAHLTARFPQIFRFCLDHGVDITKSPIPVVPAAHYFMGGVRTDLWGETSIPGLFACGEVACTGVHGANRLASNSLLEAVVFPYRLVARTRQKSPHETLHSVEAAGIPQRPPLPKTPLCSGPTLQGLTWDKVGIVRNGPDLEAAATTLATWQAQLAAPSERPSWELHHMVLVARLMAEAALIREESRGAHYRTDFPNPSPTWQRHIVLRTGT